MFGVGTTMVGRFLLLNWSLKPLAIRERRPSTGVRHEFSAAPRAASALQAADRSACSRRSPGWPGRQACAQLGRTHRPGRPVSRRSTRFCSSAISFCIQVVRRRLHGRIGRHAAEPLDLAAHDLDPFTMSAARSMCPPQLEEHAHLRLDVCLGAFRMRILDDRQRLGELASPPAAASQCTPRRHQNRHPAGVRGRPPAFGAHSHVGRV